MLYVDSPLPYLIKGSVPYYSKNLVFNISGIFGISGLKNAFIVFCQMLGWLLDPLSRSTKVTRLIVPCTGPDEK